MRYLKTSYILLVLLILIVSGNLLSSQNNHDKTDLPNEPEKVVEYLMNLSHGFPSRMHPEATELIEKIKNNKEKYGKYLLSVSDEIVKKPKVIIDNKGIRTQLHISRVMKITKLIHSSDSDYASKIMRNIFDKLLSRMNYLTKKIKAIEEDENGNREKQEKIKSALQRLEDALDNVLRTLADLSDTYAIDYVLDNIEKTDQASRNIMLFKYLGEVAKENKKVIKILEEKYQNESSKLHKSRELKKALQKIKNDPSENSREK